MKRTALILAVVITLSGSTFRVRANGGCYGFWPFWPLALGAGIALASVASAQNYSAPAYIYAPPAYPYSYNTFTQPQSSSPAVDTAPSASTPVTEPEPTQPSDWVPSSPGVGHWVPDPTPYSYNPTVQNKTVPTVVAPSTELVTVTRSAGNVPVYTITR